MLTGNESMAECEKDVSSHRVLLQHDAVFCYCAALALLSLVVDSSTEIYDKDCRD